MRLLTVVFGLFVALIFSLEGSYQSEVASSPANAPKPSESVNKKKSLEKDFDANHVYANSSLPDHESARSSSSADGQDIWKEFFHSLYVDRTFNSSFALNVPLFTLTIPGYGRGVKTQSALSALNVGKFEARVFTSCFGDAVAHSQLTLAFTCRTLFLMSCFRSSGLVLVLAGLR